MNVCMRAQLRVTLDDAMKCCCSAVLLSCRELFSCCFSRCEVMNLICILAFYCEEM
jgi:hypothetical protein